MAEKAECSQKGWDRGFKDLLLLLDWPPPRSDEAWELAMFRCCSKALQNSIKLRQSTIETLNHQGQPRNRPNTQTKHRKYRNFIRTQAKSHPQRSSSSDLPDKDRGGQIPEKIRSQKPLMNLPESLSRIQQTEISISR